MQPAQEPKKTATRRYNRKVGEYTIIAKIGEGAMGEVYEAIQDSLQRKVALKVLPAYVSAEPEQVERFHREAQAAARLHHPHIVPVYGSGTDGGTHYYAMEFVRGRTLKELIADPARPLKDTRRLAKYCIQVGEALDYAHRAGVIHRDVKPANVLIKDGDDKAVIADFGLARQETARAITREGMLMGTPTYMAPEQALGEPIDARIDVWALGVVLYEGLTLGKLPFASTDLRELILQITTEAPAPVRRIRPEAPWELEAIAMKALAKKKEDRYQSARELADDLIRYMRGDVIYAAPTPFGLLVRKRIEKHRIAFALGAALLFVVVAAPVYFALAGSARTRAQAAALLAEARASEQRGELEEALSRLKAARQLDPRDLSVSSEVDRVGALAAVRKAEADLRIKDEARRVEQEKAARDRAQQAESRLKAAEVIASKNLDEWRRRTDTLGNRLKARSEALLVAGTEARVAELSGQIDVDRETLARIEDELSRGAEEALANLEAAALATEAPLVAARATTMARDLLRVLRTWAERQGDERLAALYAHEAKRLVGGGAPNAAADAVTFSIRTVPPAARAKVAWVTYDGDARIEAAPTLLRTTPLDETRTPAGRVRSCVLELDLEGYVKARVPFLVAPGEHVTASVRLVPTESVPSGYVYVAAGEVFDQHDREAVRARRRAHPEWVDSFFIGETEVTLGDWLEFVNAAEGDARLARVPARELVELGTDGRWVASKGRLGEDPLRWPVAGVSYGNAVAYAEWLTKKDGGRVTYRLPTDDEWEKAACGVDGLAFPWGSRFSTEPRRDANVAAPREPNRLPVRPAGSFPRDRSVYGCLDVVGGVAEWTTDHFAEGIRVVRGGSFARGAEIPHLASREPVDDAQFQAARERYGFRLAFAPPGRQ